MFGLIRQDVTTMLNNGQRGLLVALLAFFAAVFAFVAVTILAFVWQRGAGPVEVTMDFRIPAEVEIKYGDGLLFSAEYCNRTDDPVVINRSVVMTEISREPHTNVLYYSNIPLTVEPGCIIEPEKIAPLPDTVVPGRWRVQHIVFTQPAEGERREVVVNQPEFTVVE